MREGADDRKDRRRGSGLCERTPEKRRARCRRSVEKERRRRAASSKNKEKGRASRRRSGLLQSELIKAKAEGESEQAAGRQQQARGETKQRRRRRRRSGGRSGDRREHGAHRGASCVSVDSWRSSMKWQQHAIVCCRLLVLSPDLGRASSAVSASDGLDRSASLAVLASVAALLRHAGWGVAAGLLFQQCSG